jgi:hypothetical protein
VGNLISHNSICPSFEKANCIIAFSKGNIEKKDNERNKI